MTRRLFYMALGATVGIVVVRRVKAAAKKWTPEGIATQAEGVGQQLGAMVSEVRRLAAEREAELREGLGLTGNDSDDDGARN